MRVTGHMMQDGDVAGSSVKPGLQRLAGCRLSVVRVFGPDGG
jgi:hypothetical protein